jgi:serine/threonine-protein kinase
VETAGGETVDHPSAPPRPAQPTAGKKGKKSAPIEVPASVAGYDILGVLGRGAMGVVYKARQRGLNRLVALKMILAGEHAGEHELARFQAEAEAVAHLHHPNIVQIYEVGEEQGKPFFSLEFVEGTSLDKKVNGTPLPPKDAAVLARKLAEAMDYAHKNDIIHRDLKPANVLLTSDGAPKVGDFGLAKCLDEDAGQTRTGTVLGTPSYMAPEQAEGRLNEVGPLSDQYSLGAILYELLTGRPPFKGATILDTLNQLRTREPAPPMDFQPGVPRDLETICLKCLQKDPAKRYASAGAMAEDLGRFLGGEPILARPVSRSERLWRWCKRNPRVAGLTAAVVGLIFVSVVGLAVFSAMLKTQKDIAEEQKGIAEEKKKEADASAEEANKQKGIAEEKKKEADANAQRADREATIARQNEQKAKDTAKIAVDQVIGLGGSLHNRLQTRHSSQATAPEARRLRDEVLGLLRQSMVNVGKEIEAAQASIYGQESAAVELGDLLSRLGQDEEAAKLYCQAYESLKKQAEALHDDEQTQANFGMTQLRMGDAALKAERDLPAAVARYAEARDLLRDLLAHPRAVPRSPLKNKISLAHADIRMGKAHLLLGKPAEARKYLEEAVDLRQEWIDAEPTSAEARSWMTEAREWLGIACSHLGDDRGMRGHLGASLHTTEGPAFVYPTDFSFKEDLAEIQGAWGDALLRLGLADDAATSYEASLKNLRLVIDRYADDMARQDQLALARERLGSAVARLNRPDDARKHFAEALKLREEMRKLEPKNVTWQAAYALALARAGKATEAAAEAAEVQPRAAKSPELLMQVARCHAACAAADTPQKADFVKKALEALRAATGKDYQDAVALRTDPDLDALRTEPGFRAVFEKARAAPSRD